MVYHSELRKRSAVWLCGSNPRPARPICRYVPAMPLCQRKQYTGTEKPGRVGTFFVPTREMNSTPSLKGLAPFAFKMEKIK